MCSNNITKDHHNTSHLHITSNSIENIVQPPIRTEIDDFFDDKLLIHVIDTGNQPSFPIIAKPTKATRRLLNIEQENKIEYPEFEFTPTCCSYIAIQR
jgi:hypothetical protein